MKTTPGFNPRRFFLTAAFLAGMGFVTHASAEAYLIDLKARTATDLGDFQPTALNDVGQVVENSYVVQHAFITGPNGVGMRDLGGLPGYAYSYATGINNAGQVVGASYVPEGIDNGHPHAFITGPNGVGMTDIGARGSSDSGIEASINASGQVAGSVSGIDLSAYSGAFITGPNGVDVRSLSGLQGYANNFADSINDAGQVAGGSSSPYNSNPSRAFITGPNGVGVRNLGTLGGASWSNGINNAGQVVGDFYTVGGHQLHAFITDANGGEMRDLGTLGGEGSRADGINAAGQVVGESFTADGQEHVFITGPNGVGMTDLNSLVHLPAGLVLENAVAINNMGQVIATGFTPIPAIPEPQSYALLLAGLVLTGVMVRRKQKVDSLEGALGS